MSQNVIIMGAGGRMGGMLCRMATEREEYTLAGVVERPGNEAGLDAWDCPASTDLGALLPQVDDAVIVDFTAPEASVKMARIAAEHGTPAVIGTTGLDSGQQAELEALAKDVPLFWAPNMSVGVNVLLKLLPDLVRMLGEAYDMEMVELHHNKKADAPSGTAIKLAQCLAEARGWDYDEVKRYCREGLIGARDTNELGVQTIRGGDVVGDHTIYMLGPGERIEVTHRAHSRETFAQGGLRAAAWLAGQAPGRLYSMADVF